VKRNNALPSPILKILSLAGGGLILLVVVPALFKGQPYLFHILIVTMFNIVLGLSANFIMRTGQVPLCLAAFMGIGAYTSTLLVMRLHWLFWVSLPLAGLMGAFIGFLIGLPTMRIKGIHFAMATFAFGEIMRLIFIAWVDLFGGATGIAGIPSPDPIRIPFLPAIKFESKSAYYYLALGFLILSLVVFYRLTFSRIGRAGKAIEEADNLSQCIGINITGYKIMAFTICAFFVAVVGALDAHYMHFVGPQQYGFWNSVAYITFVIIGGGANFLGPLLGAVFLTFLPEFLRVADTWEVVMYGMALMLTILFMPRGLAGFFGDVKLKFAGNENEYENTYTKT
jgi:branched-chain amino acid transport system permease protein